MSAMNSLQTACSKRVYKSFENLAVGEYIIKSFTMWGTEFGPRIRIDMDETFMFLPKRFADALTEPQVVDLNKSPKIMVYSGKDDQENGRLILDFKELIGTVVGANTVANAGANEAANAAANDATVSDTQEMMS